VVAEYHPLITYSISLVLCFSVYANFLSWYISAIDSNTEIKTSSFHQSRKPRPVSH